MNVTRMDLKIHNATPKVNGVNDLVWLDVELPSDGLTDHVITLFFPNPAAAVACGEALMRAGYKAREIEKLNKQQDTDVDVPRLLSMTDT